MDRAARRQLLLTRAAVERSELMADLGRVRQSVGVPQLLRAALGTSLLRDLFGDTARGGRGWAHTGLALLRRYRLVAAAFGIVWPLLRRRGLRRILVGVSVATLGWAAARYVQTTRPGS